MTKLSLPPICSTRKRPNGRSYSHILAERTVPPLWNLTADTDQRSGQIRVGNHTMTGVRTMRFVLETMIVFHLANRMTSGDQGQVHERLRSGGSRVRSRRTIGSTGRDGAVWLRSCRTADFAGVSLPRPKTELTPLQVWERCPCPVSVVRSQSSRRLPPMLC